MAKKLPVPTTKAWKPGDPLKVDQAMQKYDQDHPTADPLQKADAPLVSQALTVNQPMKPANHKAHIRQKKG